jgi:hypothetical protein
MFPLFFAIGWRSHSVFAVNQGIWVALFMTGTSDTAGDITLDHFQPTLDLILAREVTKLYSGQWSATRGDSEIFVRVDDGSLWLSKLVLNGTDVLRFTQGITDALKKPTPITLWSTERHHEFRLVDL